MEQWFMKAACIHCPFRRDVKPFLHPERGAELAFHSENPYNTFPCHKTTVSDEVYGGEGENMVTTQNSLECAGFLTLQIHNGKSCPKGFTPDENAFGDTWEMLDAYDYDEDIEEEIDDIENEY